MLSNYWYKAIGKSYGVSKTMEGGIKAETDEQALAIIEGYKNTWNLTVISSIYIYEVGKSGEISEDPSVYKDYPDHRLLLPHEKSHNVTKESIADMYEAADWTDSFKEPDKFPIVTLKEKRT